VAVVNADDESHELMIADARGEFVKFGFTENADYWARDIAVTSFGIEFHPAHAGRAGRGEDELIGRHNIQNALTAAALVGEVFDYRCIR